MTRLIKLAFASTFVSLAACGGGGGISADDAIHEGVHAVCEKAFECEDEFDGGGFVTFEDIYGTSVDDCASRFEAEVGDVGASVDAGRIEYNADDAQACLDGTDFGTCEQFFMGDYDEPAECDTAFVGTVPNGDDCETSLDCADEDALCDGVCIVP